MRENRSQPIPNVDKEGLPEIVAALDTLDGRLYQTRLRLAAPVIRQTEKRERAKGQALNFDPSEAGERWLARRRHQP